MTEPAIVCDEVCRIYRKLYPKSSVNALQKAFIDMEALFRGNFPGYYACDAPYHDLQHSLDVTLATARLIAGYVRTYPDSNDIGQVEALICLICALFHDAGYIRHLSDPEGVNGAELLKSHVSRGGRFLIEYLPTLDLAPASQACAKSLHFTGYEKRIHDIDLINHNLKLLGYILGTADLMAQMSDRCYLEKCRDRLYLEFIAAGIANPDDPENAFSSPEKLLRETPKFIDHVLHDRLGNEFAEVYRCFEAYFAPEPNLYMVELMKNRDYIAKALDKKDLGLLNLKAPYTLNPDTSPINPVKYRK